MIKLLTHEKTEQFMSFCRDKIPGAVLYTRLLTYGLGDRDSLFWYKENENGQITAALGMTDSVLTVCGKDAVSCEELMLFAQTVGTREISFPNARHILIFEQNEKSPEAQRVTGENLSDLFDVIFENDKNRSDYFSVWYTDASHKIRHGLIHGFSVYRDGKCVSAALTSGETDEIAVISSVATLKEYRCRGLGEATVTALAKSLNKLNKKVYLMTNDDKICDWYIKIGFKHTKRGL